MIQYPLQYVLVQHTHRLLKVKQEARSHPHRQIPRRLVLSRKVNGARTFNVGRKKREGCHPSIVILISFDRSWVSSTWFNWRRTAVGVVQLRCRGQQQQVKEELIPGRGGTPYMIDVNSALAYCQIGTVPWMGPRYNPVRCVVCFCFMYTWTITPTV